MDSESCGLYGLGGCYAVVWVAAICGVNFARSINKNFNLSFSE